MKLIKNILTIILLGVFCNVFSQKTNTYTGFYDDKPIKIITQSNSDGSTEGYFYNTQTPKKKYAISLYFYQNSISVTIYNSIGSDKEKIAEGNLYPYQKNQSGYIDEISTGKKHFLKIVNLKN